MAAEAKPRPPQTDDTEVDAQPEPARARHEEERTTDSGIQQLVLQTELLDELRRMNRQLTAISKGSRRYTLAFFSGIVRGLGAAIGATVVFALFVAILSRVETIPLIGSYVAKVYQVAVQSSPAATSVPPTATPAASSPAPEAVAPDAKTDATPAAKSDATPAPTP